MQEILDALADELNSEGQARLESHDSHVGTGAVKHWMIYASHNVRGFTLYKYAFDLIPGDLSIKITRPRLCNSHGAYEEAEFDMMSPTGLDDLIATIKKWVRNA